MQRFYPDSLIYTVLGGSAGLYKGRRAMSKGLEGFLTFYLALEYHILILFLMEPL